MIQKCSWTLKCRKSVLIFTNMMQQHHGSCLIDKTASSILTLELSCMTTTFIIPVCLHNITHSPKSLNVGPGKFWIHSFVSVSFFKVYLIHLWNVSAPRGKEADRWRNEPQPCIFFGHLSGRLTSAWGGIRWPSEFLVTHHSLTDGFTLNWGWMRSVKERRRSPQQRRSCTALLRPHSGQFLWFSQHRESLSYFLSFRSSVYRRCVWHRS